MLLLKGRANSSNVMKALWILDEIGIEYEREDVGDRLVRTMKPLIYR